MKTEIFEKIGEKLTRTGKGAARKTKEFVEINQLNMKAAELEKQIQERYRKMGELYFEKYNVSPEQEFAPLVEEVKNAYIQKEELKNQIEQIKAASSPRCPVCGGQVNPQDAFCGGCGAKLEVPREAPDMTDTGQIQKRNQWIGIGVTALAGVALLGVIAGVIWKCSESGYEKIPKKYIQSIQDADGTLRYSLYAPDYLDYMIGNDSFFSSSEQFISDMQEECESELKDMQGKFGEDVKLTCRINSAEKLDEEELVNFNDRLESWYDFTEDSVSECYQVNFSMEASGEEGTGAYSRDAYIMKIKGKWYMQRGDMGD